MTIKILEISADAGLGGATKHIIVLAKNLKKIGYDPIIISPNGWLINEANKNKLNFYICNIKSIFDLSSIFALHKIIRKEKPDIIHLHNIRAGFIGILASINLKIPIIYSEHLYNFYYHLKSKIREKLQLMILFFILRKANLVVTPSKAVKFFLTKKLKIDSGKIEVIANGLEDLKIKNKKEKFKIGFIGGINCCKGLEYLIMAMYRLNLRFKNLKLEIIGEGPLKKEMLEKADCFRDKVIFLGKQDNVYQFLKNWKVLIVPSVSESFGLVVLEAYILKKPVVATKVGGLPEIVLDKKTGILVSPKRPGELAKAIGYILDNPKIAHSMGEAGRKLFEHKFRAKIMAADFNYFFKNILNEAKN